MLSGDHYRLSDQFSILAICSLVGSGCIMNNEYDGGTIDSRCPDCGQFCKVPDTYTVYFHKAQVDRLALKYFPSLYGDKFDGCYADSYCKRCKKPVKLSVEFI